MNIAAPRHLTALTGFTVFAALTAACSNAGEPPTWAGALDSADQVLFGMNLNLTIDGVVRVKLSADTALLYEGPQTAELYGLRVQFHSPQGELRSTVTGRTGTYEWRTGNMEARGDVVAVTPDGRRLTTALLRYERGTQQISGPEPFVFDAPDRHLEGAGFTADPDFRDVRAQQLRRGVAGDLEVEKR